MSEAPGPTGDRPGPVCAECGAEIPQELGQAVELGECPLFFCDLACYGAWLARREGASPPGKGGSRENPT